MKSSGKYFSIGMYALGLFLLILDSQTAFQGAVHGIDICIKAVIPSLFPFFILTILLTGSLSEIKIPFLRPLGKLLRLPDGFEGIFLIGLLGGYPSGAQCVIQAYKNRNLGLSQARRMLGFCSNAGPAFIFGMVGPIFSCSIVPWSLWGIHILSAIITGILLPGEPPESVLQQPGKSLGLRDALNQSIQTMANVCGWILLFRVILSFLERWFLLLFSDAVRMILTGILELSNGCLELRMIQNEYFRYILCSGFLGFGGICVLMQTVSVTAISGLGSYIPGKLLQTAVSLVLASIAGNAIYGKESVIPLILGIILMVLIILLRICGISSRNFKHVGV